MVKAPLNALLFAKIKTAVFLSQGEVYTDNARKELTQLENRGAVEKDEDFSDGGDSFYKLTSAGLELMDRNFKTTVEKNADSLEAAMDMLRIALWFYEDRAAMVLEERLKVLKKKLEEKKGFEEQDSLKTMIYNSSRQKNRQEMEEAIDKLERHKQSLEPVHSLWPGKSAAWWEQLFVQLLQTEQFHLEKILKVL